MSDYYQWLRRTQDADEHYDLHGGEIPQGHPDEARDADETEDRLQRYFDAAGPWLSVVRVDDTWDKAA